MNRKWLLGQFSVGFGVAVAHHLLQFASWAVWDRALRPGEVRTMPASSPVLSFPAFPLYDWLSGGDTDMFHSFEWVMVANSVLWGVAAVAILNIFTRSRAKQASRP